MLKKKITLNLLMEIDVNNTDVSSHSKIGTTLSQRSTEYAVQLPNIHELKRII